MTDDPVGAAFAIVVLVIFVPFIFESLSVASDQIGSDHIEKSEHEKIVGNLNSNISALKGNNSELRSDKQYLNRLVSNYSENRSDLRQERNYYEGLSENLSEENEALEQENNQLEDEVNRTVPIQRVIDYTLQVWNVHVKVVHVFAVSISFTFVITLSLVELNLFGWEGKISIKQAYKKVKQLVNTTRSKIEEGLEDIFNRI